MGFWKRNKEKIAAGTISNVLGRLIAPVVFGVGGVYAGSKIISSPLDDSIIKGAGTVAAIVVLLFAFTFGMYFPLILEWLAYRRESDLEKIKLENENLKLKLELKRQEHQSPPDNDE